MDPRVGFLQAAHTACVHACVYINFCCYKVYKCVCLCIHVAVYMSMCIGVYIACIHTYQLVNLAVLQLYVYKSVHGYRLKLLKQQLIHIAILTCWFTSFYCSQLHVVAICCSYKCGFPRNIFIAGCYSFIFHCYDAMGTCIKAKILQIFVHIYMMHTARVLLI